MPSKHAEQSLVHSKRMIHQPMGSKKQPGRRSMGTKQTRETNRLACTMAHGAHGAKPWPAMHHNSLWSSLQRWVGRHGVEFAKISWAHTTRAMIPTVLLRSTLDRKCLCSAPNAPCLPSLIRQSELNLTQLRLQILHISSRLSTILRNSAPPEMSPSLVGQHLIRVDPNAQAPVYQPKSCYTSPCSPPTR